MIRDSEAVSRLAVNQTGGEVRLVIDGLDHGVLVPAVGTCRKSYVEGNVIEQVWTGRRWEGQT